MSMKVGSLESVTIGRFSYVFIIVVWNDYQSGIKTELEAQFEPFGKDLGGKGLVVSAFASANKSLADELLAKPWPEKVAARLAQDQEPIMVIIDRDFSNFDPASNPWTILWFSQWKDSPQTIYQVFRLLAEKSSADEDVFHYVARISKKKKFQKFVQYLELKPNFQGVGINVNAILEDALAA